MTELPIPVSFRSETVQQVVRLLRSGESCALVGVGSSGKSNIARHLARPDVRQEYFGAEAAATLVVYLNCKPFAHRAPADFYLEALHQLGRALDSIPDAGALAGARPAVATLWQAAQTDPDVLARRNLDQALGLAVQAGAQHLIFILDDCDDLLHFAPPYFFSDLRGLRDNYKVRLVYLTLTRREPAFLRDDTPEFEELFELLSSPGHTLPVAPYVETDALLMLRRLAARQVPARALSEPEARRLFDLSGGHAGLLRALFFATQYTPDLAASLMSPSEWTRLADHADVEGECRKIWDSLEVEEQDDLRRLARRQAPTADGLRRLERRGLARAHFSRPPELFSPVFERCLHAILGEAGSNGSATHPAANAPVEFLELGRQVRIDGHLITDLLAPEYEVLRCLTNSAPEPCELLTMIEAMRLAEQLERSGKPSGDPLRRLDNYLRQLKAKLGPAGHRLQPAGQGYRWEP
jgi:hypothetical protein